MVDAQLLAPFHIISYGTLLGTQVFQSIFAGPTAYRALPRPQFASLQTAIFPVYFSIQTALPIVLALTYPGSQPNPSSLSGVMAEDNRLSVLTPLVIMFATGLANLVAVGPATTKIMKDRKHQETRDGRKSYDPPPHSKEMTQLNNSFAKMHGVSALTNLVGLAATMWYGKILADRMH